MYNRTVQTKANNFILFTVPVGAVAGHKTKGEPLMQRNIMKDKLKLGHFLKTIIGLLMCGQKGKCTVFNNKNALSVF